MTEIQERIKERARQTNHRELDLSDVVAKLQHQVNELVARVTGVKQVKRRYLAAGLIVGTTVGLTLGIFISNLIHSITGEHQE